MNSEIKKVLNTRKNALENSKKDFKAIFNIMFSGKNAVLCEGNNGFRIYKYTYGEIYQRIINAAGVIFEKIGARHSFIALEMENGADWIVGFWAILMSGNKPYLVNMRYPESLTGKILETLEIEFIIAQSNGSLKGEYILSEELNSKTAASIPEDAFEDEIAFSSSATSMNEVICFYSGFQVSEQILNFKSIVKTNPRIAKHYKGSLKQLAFLPFYHIFGLFAVYFWFTFFGRTLVFLRDYSADTILSTCKRHNVTHIFAVPMLWHTIEKQIMAAAVDEGKEQKLKKGIKFATGIQNIFPNFGAFFAKRFLKEVTDKLFGKSVVFCISGGSYLRDSALELLNGMGYKLHNGFGMSEVGITSVELRKKAAELNQNSIGRPFTSVEYKIEDGELVIKGSSLCKKKLVNGEPVNIEGWFKTGDIVEEKNGNYYILGRKGDMVIGESGENINPDSVEKLFNLSSVKCLSVLGLEGENGEELSMVAQINPYLSHKKITEIRDEIYAVNETLPIIGRIVKFYFTIDDIMPPTAIKISRRQLISKIKRGEVKLIPFSEMSGTMESEICQSDLFLEVRKIVSKALNKKEEEISPESHIFYDLGATSIQYFSLLTELAQHFEITDYESSDKYRYTLKEMCKYIEEHL